MFLGFELENRGAKAGIEAGAVEFRKRLAHLVPVGGAPAALTSESDCWSTRARTACAVLRRTASFGHQVVSTSRPRSWACTQVFHAAGQIALIGA